MIQGRQAALPKRKAEGCVVARPSWRGDACIRVQGLVPGDGSPEGVSRSLDAGQSPALLCVVCRQVGVLVASSAFP